MNNDINSLTDYLKKYIIDSSKIKLELWMPSFRSIVKITVVLLLIYIIELTIVYLVELYDLNFVDKLVGSVFNFTSLPNDDLLLNIHTGIWAVVIGLAFFVAQSLANENEPNQGRVLLRESYFFPLLIGELINSIMLLIKGYYISKLIVAIIFSLITIYSLKKVVTVLISDYKMKKIKSKMLLDIIKDHYQKLISKEYSTRVGNNIMRQIIDSLKYFTMEKLEDETDKAISLYSNNPGVITDISILKLKIFENSLTTKLEKTMFDDLVPNQDIKEVPVFYTCNLNVSYNQEIEQSHKLFTISSSNKSFKLNNNEIINLEKLARNIFTIKKSNDVEEKAKYEISKIKDLCLTAINNNQTGRVREALGFYIDIVGLLYDYFEKIDLRYDGDLANNESKNIFEPFLQIEWLNRDIREIYKAGLNCSNTDIHIAVMHIPIRIARYAISKRDHLLFNQFIQYQSILYYYYWESDPKSKLLFSRVWTHLTETANFYIAPMLRKPQNGTDDFNNYSDQIFLQFSNLLKKSIDKKAIYEFQTLLDKANNLFKNINHSYLDFEKVQTIQTRVQNRKEDLNFGLASWIVSKMFECKVESDFLLLQELYQIIELKLPNDFNAFSKVFFRCQQNKHDDFWPWDDWLIFELEAGVAGFIDLSGQFNKLYIYHSLTLLNSLSPSSIKHINLTLDDESKFYFSENGGINKLIESIVNKVDINECIKNSIDQKTIKNIKEIFSHSLAKKEEDDLEVMRNTIIDKEIISEFANEIFQDYLKHSYLKNIFIYKNLYRSRVNKVKHKKIDNFGVIQNISKTIFTSGASKNSRGLGIGRTLANGETNEIIDKLIISSKSIRKSEFEDLLQSKFNDEYFVLVSHMTVWNYLKTASFNKVCLYEDIAESTNGLVGSLLVNNKKIDVYDCLFDKNISILILNKKKFGKLTQLKTKPIPWIDKPDYEKEGLSLNVVDYTKDTDIQDNMIESPNDFLTQKGSELDQRNYLKGMVYVNLSERFKLKLEDDFEGFYISDEL